MKDLLNSFYNLSAAITFTMKVLNTLLQYNRPDKTASQK